MCQWLKKLLGRESEADATPISSPTLTREEVIAELEYDIQIHESYAVWVVEEPSRYPPEVYGDYDWHMRWIEVYQSAIHYIREAK